jgi:hypothetical protein
VRVTTKRPERELRNAILTLLRAHGIAAWPTGVGAFPASYQGRHRFVRVGTKGMSDIVGIVPCTAHGIDCPCPRGGFLALEVKSPGGTVSPEQTAFLQTVTRAGGIGFVARSLEDVMETLGLGDGR